MAMFLIILLILAAGFAVYKISRQPDEFSVTRSILIDAPPEAIYPYLSDLRKGNEWGPWAEMDPDMKHVYGEETSSVGAVYSWHGNNKVGQGVITILELNPDRHVRLRLDFLKPMKATNTVDYTLAPESGKTRMSWRMFGPNSLMGKIMGLFMDCEKMCGDMFEKGLANLKTLVENQRG